MIKVFLPDGSFKEFNSNPSALDLAKSIGDRLANDTVGVKINGLNEIKDLRQTLQDGDRVELVTIKSKSANEVIRHSAAHIMAEAVQQIWADVKVTIGPVIEDGFYYDFDTSRTFTESDFTLIESKMKEITIRNSDIVRQEWPITKAIEVFEKLGERYKVELIKELAAKGEKVVSIYYQGEWFDLCRGPHLQRTGQLKSFKLLSVAGAYWRGNEKNPMLQRIYATAFRDNKELESYLARIEEAKRRDHRKLGRELDLFHFHRLAPASPIFTSRGAHIYHQLIGYLRELYLKYDYKEVITPQIFESEARSSLPSPMARTSRT